MTNPFKLPESGIRFGITLPKNINRAEMLNWCETNFGPENIIGGKWFCLEHTIHFNKKEDLEWFLVRWS